MYWNGARWVGPLCHHPNRKTKMQITFNSKELESRLAKSVNLDQFDLALKIGARDIQERAKDIHKFKTRTGNLDNSIVTKNERLKHSVGIDTRSAHYGVFQHDGTKAHSVKPKNKTALRFVGSGGRFYFSKGHNVSGIKPDKFIHRAWKLEKKNILNKITKNIRQYISGIH